MADGLDNTAFLTGGGAMGALIAAHDWSATPLGPIEGWPASLGTALGMVLASPFPMVLGWGPELIALHNDAYRPLLGDKPDALGRPFVDVWAEARSTIVPLLERALAGEACRFESMSFILERRGHPEEAYFDFCFSPVRDETGAVVGVLNNGVETTARVLSERQQAAERERLARVFEHVPVGVGLFDAQGRFTLKNPQLSDLLGDMIPSRDAVAGHLWEALDATGRPVPPEDYPGARALRGEDATSPVDFRRFDGGGERWLRVSAVPVREGAAVVGGITVVQDVTDERRVQAEVRAHAAQQRFRVEVGDALRPLNRPAEIEAEATRLLCSELHASRVHYAEIEPDGEHAVVVEDFAPTAPNRAGRYRLADFPALIAECRAGRNFISTDLQADPRIGEAEKAVYAFLPVAAIVVVPLIKQGRLVSTLAVHRDAPHAWPAGEVALIEETADRTWAAIERARAEAGLRASEARYRALFEQAAAGFAQTDLSGRFTSVNNRFCEITGRTRDELLGTRMQDITSPDDLGVNVPRFEAATAGGEAFEIEKRYVRPDGSTVWVRNSVTGVRGPSGEIDAVLAVSIDITDRKRAEEALRESEGRFREIADAAPVLIWISDTSKACTWFNRPWLEFTGRTMNEEYGYGWAEGVHPDDFDRCVATYNEAFDRREPFRMDYRLRRQDGEYRIFDDAGVPRFAEDGTFLGYIGACTDVTEARHAEQVVRELNETLEQRVTERTAELSQAQEALRQSQKLEAMGQLTGGVAHDFNNLLTPIIGSLDMLTRRGVGNERERRLIDGGLQSAERAKTLVQRLLAFARRQPLQATAVDVKRLVGGMADLVASTSGPTIDVRVELPDDLPPAVADANQLEMAILNLAVNARDAMPDGGVLTISASRESVRSGHRSKLRQGHYVRLSVADTGTGMDEATLSRAIEPFFSTKGIGKGTGLGLSMVHGLALQLNGGLTISSRPGQGTTIDLWLPISSVLADTDGEALQTAPAPKALGKALLVDDEDLVRMSTADMLMDLGYEVVEAASAEEALRLVGDGFVPDLLVTDHLMPGMSGADLARDLRARRPELPVLIVSGYAEAEGIAPDMPRLTKPFRTAELAASLATLIPAGAG